MNALILVAHGSRHLTSNDEVRRLVAQLRQNQTDFEIVDVAFLELAEPLLSDSIENVINQGATQISILPYLLSTGRHVTKDIPEAIARVKTAQIDIMIKPHIGSMEAMLDLLLKAVK